MGSDEDPQEYDWSRKLFRFGIITTSIVGILMIVLMGLWIGQYAGGTAVAVNIHIMLMLIFFVFLHGHVSLIYRIFPETPKLKVKLAHFLLHGLILFAVAVGLYYAIKHHNNKNDPHFYSFHSWIGLLTIVLYYGQFLVGFGAFLLPMTPMRIRQLILPFHKFAGPLVFLLASGTSITGVMMKALGALANSYHDYPAAGLLINFTGTLIVIFSLLVIYLLYEHKYRRRPRPEGDILLSSDSDQQINEIHLVHREEEKGYVARKAK